MEKRNQICKLIVSALIVVATALWLAGVFGGDMVYQLTSLG